MHVSPSFVCLLIFTVSLAFVQESFPADSDRDKAELRGPVKTVVNEQTFSGAGGQQFSIATTTDYSRDGRILEQRTRNTDGSEWVVSYTYDGDGRLLKTLSGKAASGDRSETKYFYDDKGRLIAVKVGGKVQTRYEYDEAGRKIAIESCDSTPLPENSAYVPHWEGTDLGFAPSPGGKVRTLYNEQGVATGAQFYDAEGNRVGHITRNFDANGRVVTEEQMADAPRLDLPAKMRSQLNPEQLKAVGALMSGMQNSAISYSYDDQGRMMERHRVGGVIGEQTTVTTYNSRGDKATERHTMYMRSDTGPWGLTESGAFIPSDKPNPSQPPHTSETEYRYQYDEYGNWTEMSIVARGESGQAFGPATVIRRKLVYF